MTIQQQPSALSLWGNMQPFIINSASLVSFTLKDGAQVIMEATYEPDSKGKVTIDIKDVINGRLSYTLNQELAFYEQTQIAKAFTAIIDSTTYTFKVVRGEVLDLADTPTNWLTGNFLTWQPQNKAVTYYSPEWLTYYATEACTIKLKAYFPDKAEQNVTLGSCQAGKAFTFDVGYARVAGFLNKQYPAYYDVWAEDSQGVRLTFIQRYYYSDVKSEMEQWFGFENSLGGFDVLRATGDTDLGSEAEHKLALVDSELKEYKIDTKRIYTKNTGHLTRYERKWLLDFQSSRAKYIYYHGAIRPIAMVESDFNYAASELPSNYEFKYRFVNQSSALNLIRNQEDIPSEITIPNIDAPNFSLPPRLSEYPRATLHEGVILPAFDPSNDEPSVTTFGAILTAAVFEVLQKIEAGEGGGELVNILRSTSSGEASDYSVFSSLRASKEINAAIENALSDLDFSDTFLSKLKDDVAHGLIRFAKGAEFGEYMPGMFGGTGANIDEHGNMEVQSVTSRGKFSAPEYQFNRVTIIGDELILSENGTINSVEHLSDRTYLAEMDVQPGEGIAFQTGDLVKGIFHESYGFSTSYLIVGQVFESSMQVTMALDADTPTKSNIAPQQFMKIARVGSNINPERQRYMVFSSKLGGYQFYDGCSTFLNGTLAASFDTAQSFEKLYGELHLIPGLPYLYAAGIVTQDIVRVNYEGVPIREVTDTGPWEYGRRYFNNDEKGTEDVWHLGCRWRCFSDNTTEEPSWSSPAWIMIEGRSDVRMEFDSSNGTAFFANRVDTMITPIVFIGNTNVSKDIVEEQWSWTRQSGYPDADAVWNAKHKKQRLLYLTNEDMGQHWSRSNPVRFICTAIYPASSINAITNYLEI